MKQGHGIGAWEWLLVVYVLGVFAFGAMVLGGRVQVYARGGREVRGVEAAMLVLAWPVSLPVMMLNGAP